MTRRKNISLNIERFYHGDNSEFRVPSAKEILSILQNLAEKGTHAVLYYDAAHNFIPTTVLAATADGVWLDVGPFPPENKRVLLSDKITVVSLHQDVKIQFEVHDIQDAVFDDAEAFFIERPDYLLRIQRREYFRLNIPLSTPIKCRIPIKSANPDEPAVTREFPVLDISGGGVALICEEDETELQPGGKFQDCQIPLPGFGILTVNLHVKVNIKFTTHNDLCKVRIGCEFHRLNNQASSMLQRYITHLQGEILAKGNF